MINQDTQVVHSLIYSLAILGEMWFLTAGPMVCITMVLTEFPQGKELREFLQEA